MSFLRILLFIVTIFLFTGIMPPIPALAQSQTNIQTDYFRATVTNVTTSVENNATTQEITAQITDGEEKGNTVALSQTVSSDTASQLLINDGETVILSKITTDGDTQYAIYDRYRLPPLLFILGAFFVLVIIAAGKKGLGAIIGLGISIAVLLLYIVPQILNGANPLFVTISGSFLIMVVTIYLAHGFSQRTSVALGGTFLSLIITGFLATGMVEILGLTGLGSEDAALLQVGNAAINMKGLLLGGIIIGTLGVLDDVTTTQSATIYTLAETNSKLSSGELTKKGLHIGREHITSLVNTLVLAYAGASLPIFIFFVLNPLDQPLWLLVNNEMITEEIVRTLSGSIGLILAVPITTILAAFFSRYNVKIN